MTDKIQNLELELKTLQKENRKLKLTDPLKEVKRQEILIKRQEIQEARLIKDQVDTNGFNNDTLLIASEIYKDNKRLVSDVYYLIDCIRIVNNKAKQLNENNLRALNLIAIDMLLNQAQMYELPLEFYKPCTNILSDEYHFLVDYKATKGFLDYNSIGYYKRAIDIMKRKDYIYGTSNQNNIALDFGYIFITNLKNQKPNGQNKNMSKEGYLKELYKNLYETKDKVQKYIFQDKGNDVLTKHFVTLNIDPNFNITKTSELFDLNDFSFDNKYLNKKTRKYEFDSSQPKDLDMEYNSTHSDLFNGMKERFIETTKEVNFYNSYQEAMLTALEFARGLVNPNTQDFLANRTIAIENKEAIYELMLEKYKSKIDKIEISVLNKDEVEFGYIVE